MKWKAIQAGVGAALVIGLFILMFATTAAFCLLQTGGIQISALGIGAYFYGRFDA